MKSVDLIKILENNYDYYTCRIVENCYIFFDELSTVFDSIEFELIELIHEDLFHEINKSSRENIINIVGENYDTLTNQQKNNLENFIKFFHDNIYIETYELSHKYLTEIIFNSLKNTIDYNKESHPRKSIEEIKIFFSNYFKKNKSILLQNLRSKLRNSLTIPEVFIIEGVSKIDKKSCRLDGKHLYDLLNMGGYNPKYYEVSSFEELNDVLKIFKKSKYRFLHFSTHASLEEIYISDEKKSYLEFCKKMGEEHQKTFFQHRITFSACELGNELFMRLFGNINLGGIHSIVAPVQKIRFEDASAIWASFYLAMLAQNEIGMNSKMLNHIAENVSALFPKVGLATLVYMPKEKDLIFEKYPKSDV